MKANFEMEKKREEAYLLGEIRLVGMEIVMKDLSEGMRKTEREFTIFIMVSVMRDFGRTGIKKAEGYFSTQMKFTMGIGQREKNMEKVSN
jgi:hypothetical protein